MVSSRSFRRIFALPPGAPCPPPSYLTLVSAGLFLTLFFFLLFLCFCGILLCFFKYIFSTTVAVWLSRAPWRLELVLSGMGQPQPLLTEAPQPPRSVPRHLHPAQLVKLHCAVLASKWNIPISLLPRFKFGYGFQKSNSIYFEFKILQEPLWNF